MRREKLMNNNIATKVLKLKLKLKIKQEFQRPRPVNICYFLFVSLKNVLVLFSCIVLTIICLNQSSFQRGQAATNMIITNSRLLAEAMTELEELLFNARIPLKIVRKEAAKSTSNALIRGMPKKSKRSLMEIDVIEKHFVSSRDMLRDFIQAPHLVSALGSSRGK
ncbi:hypothetical protein Cgig2_025431 [Carnegiea gigantea]|uniref:Uncharacterized protein n=1 Tax=Carnegiea gigantea TaxID=171969 RepID=A0A9Q1KQF9_9CARY|nr:hypothetical protein Cgig2_025431 [Carnegiea gigantea]